MEQFYFTPIGKIKVTENEMIIAVDQKFIPALRELNGFSHVNVFWWFSDFDNEQARNILETESPYKNSPDIMGIFATRSPVRPNPIALTVSQILSVDHQKGIIHIAFIDANNNTPVIDLKPYTPSLDRIENPSVPDWCAHWPKSSETSAGFNWEDEFNF